MPLESHAHSIEVTYGATGSNGTLLAAKTEYLLPSCIGEP